MECANSVRVRQAQWCDGLDHCGDNSDETDCAAGKTTVTSTEGDDDNDGASRRCSSSLPFK